LGDPLLVEFLEITPQEKTFIPTAVAGNRVTYLDTLSIVIPEGAKVVAGKEGIYRFSEESFISLSSYEGFNFEFGVIAGDDISLIKMLSTTPKDLDLDLFDIRPSTEVFKNLLMKKTILPGSILSIDYMVTLPWNAVVFNSDRITDITLFTATGSYSIMLVGKEAQDAASMILSSIEALKPGF
jgi:hypothetical protein